MGNKVSSAPSGERSTDDVISESETMSNPSGDNIESEHEEFHDTIDVDEARTKAKEEEMEEFRKQLEIKREQRKEILARHRNEKETLERALDTERKGKLEAFENNKMLRELLARNNIEIPENLQSLKETSDITNTIYNMREEFEKFKTNNLKLRRDLAEANLALQSAYSDIAGLTSQNTESIRQISALREVITCSKTMISLREQQLTELKNKLNEIERSLADREANMLSADLRQEYERQLNNIRTLRGLYEERARLAEVTRLSLVRELEEQKLLKQVEINKCIELTSKLEELETKVDELQETVESKNNQIFTFQEETRGLQAEMSVVNKLFSQVLLGYKTKQDLDKLVLRLEENHGLLTHMAEMENDSEASSALPKLLLELISQVDEGEENQDAELQLQQDSAILTEGNKETETLSSQNTSAEEIVQNLPKVWRVLIELLSHQSTADENCTEKVTTCYKSVETNAGPVLVPSVSQTYIRLKDLILEKLALNKEVNRMKQLNVHLETRLNEQEKRLCLVTTELSKTWHVVGRLRRQHHQLHTHEKILKYELQQKRKLLNELKEELEYCREKWDQAREKNNQSEKDWRKLRAEFSSRKTKENTCNNSAESGYSDERPSEESSESNDESEHVTEPLKKSKQKLKKSVETILDSSADFNLAAEREDPASDLLDVADLPLDTQDGDDNHETSVTDSCSDSLVKNDIMCEETEDEICEITNDSTIEESTSAESHPKDEDRINKDGMCDKHNEDTNSRSSNINLAEIPGPTLIDPAAILKSIREQNERLALKDKKLERLEKSGAALLRQTQATAKFSEQINSTLDHLINRPTSSRQNEHEIMPKSIDIETESSSSQILFTDLQGNDMEVNVDNEINVNQIINKGTVDKTKNEIDKESENITVTSDLEGKSVVLHKTKNQPSTNEQSTSQIPSVDLNAILGSIKQQNERLIKKEERLKNLEAGCSEVVSDISNTLRNGEEIIDKLENLHKEHQGEGSVVIEADDKEEDGASSRDGSEPTNSGDIDHEARFAARDLRLKRLEEQTKSLVTKVNKTTTKGVKIQYKLQELHNIYASESSRAGTPADDSEDSSQNDDEPQDTQ